MRFIDQYRSYVINYNLGKDMVAAYIESRGGIDRRWPEFARLISSPRLPSALAVNPKAQIPNPNHETTKNATDTK